MAGTNTTAPDNIQAAERAQKILKLRRDGATYREIAAQTGITFQRAYQIVSEYIQEQRDEAAETGDQMRAIELERIDRLIMAIMPDAKNGKLGAIDRVVKLMERKAKLCGLDGPIKIAPTNPEGTDGYSGITDEERLAAISSILADAAKAGA